jgi:hypothetical protein
MKQLPFDLPVPAHLQFVLSLLSIETEEQFCRQRVEEMKKITAVCIQFFVILTFVGCSGITGAAEIKAEVTVSATPVLPTTPPQPSATTQLPEPTQQTFTIVPSPTATNANKTPTVELPALPKLPKNADRLELREVAYETVGALLSYSDKKKGEASNFEDDLERLKEKIYQDVDFLFDTLVFSLNNREAKDLLDLYALIENIPMKPWFLDKHPDDRAVNLLVDALENEIQQHGMIFENQKIIWDKTIYTITPYVIELDNDPGAEWLLKVDFPDLELITWLVYDQVNEGEYQRLKHNLPHFGFGYSLERNILTLKDITGDNLTDIIISEEWYIFGNFFTNFYVLQGDSAGFVKVRDYHRSTYAYDDLLSYELLEQNGKTNLVLSVYDDLSWGCSWKRREFYHWFGGVENKRVTGEQPPDTPECALARAVSLHEHVDDKTEQALLKSAINRFNTSDPEQREKKAFADYRLALRYALDGQDTLARQHLKKLKNTYKDEPTTNAYLTRELDPLLAQFRIDPLKLCELGYHSIHEFGAFPGWADYINSLAVYQSYPGGDPVPDAVCPYIQLVKDMVGKIQFDGNGSPEEVFKQAGLPIHSFQQYSIDCCDFSSWFVLLDTNPYMLIASVPHEEGFDWQLLHMFSSGEDQPLWLNQDVTGDGYPEMVIAVKVIDDSRWYCDNQLAYEIYSLGNVGGGYLASWVWHECVSRGNSPDLKELMSDKDGDQLSDVVVQYYKEIGPSPFEHEARRTGPVMWFTSKERQELFALDKETSQAPTEVEPETALLSGEDAAVARKNLEKAMENLSPDEPYYDNIRARYAYFIALSYELEGDSRTAIQQYLTLARQKPQTIWSNLAAARLGSK